MEVGVPGCQSEATRPGGATAHLVQGVRERVGGPGSTNKGPSRRGNAPLRGLLPAAAAAGRTPVPGVCQGCVRGVSGVCQGCVRGVSGACQGCGMSLYMLLMTVDPRGWGKRTHLGGEGRVGVTG